MTDSPDLHLDDELLSAVLDGEADVEQSAHVDACDACRARLGALRDASVLVATPVPPADAGRRDAAIAAALAAAEADTVVPLRRRRTIPTWLGAAAAVVVAVGAISLIANRGGDDDGSGGFDTAAGGDDATSNTMADEDLSTALAAPTPVVDGGDLGEVDATTLQATIEGSFGAQREAVASSPSEEAGAAADGQAPVPCEQEVRDGSPDLGALVYRATGTLEGTPVVVLAFDVPPDRWVYVLTADGCAIRNQQTYSP